MKTVTLIPQAACGARHRWGVPPPTPGLIGGLQDTTIVPAFHTAPITVSLELSNLSKCPTCGDTARMIHVEAIPGEIEA